MQQILLENSYPYLTHGNSESYQYLSRGVYLIGYRASIRDHACVRALSLSQTYGVATESRDITPQARHTKNVQRNSKWYQSIQIVKLTEVARRYQRVPVTTEIESVPPEFLVVTGNSQTRQEDLVVQDVSSSGIPILPRTTKRRRARAETQGTQIIEDERLSIRLRNREKELEIQERELKIEEQRIRIEKAKIELERLKRLDI